MTSAGRLASDPKNATVVPNMTWPKPSRPSGAVSSRSQLSATAIGGQAVKIRLAGVFEDVGVISIQPGSPTGASAASGISPSGGLCGGHGRRLPELADRPGRSARSPARRPGGRLELALLYRDGPERYERAAARWIARLIAERPKIHFSEIELAAAGFREAVHSERGVEALRGCL